MTRTPRQRLTPLGSPICLAAGACAWWPGASRRAPQGVQYEQVRPEMRRRAQAHDAIER